MGRKEKLHEDIREKDRNKEIDTDELGLDWAEKWVKKWGENWRLY